MKKLTICWLILIFILLISLSLIGISISKKKIPYKALENDIVEATKIYYGQDTNLSKLPKDKNTSKVTIGELEAFGLDINNIINGDTCEGFGLVTKKEVAFSYKAYIKCKDYETKDYNKYNK